MIFFYVFSFCENFQPILDPRPIKISFSVNRLGNFRTRNITKSQHPRNTAAAQSKLLTSSRDCESRASTSQLRRSIAESWKLEERCSRLRRHCYIPSRLRWQSKHLATATVARSSKLQEGCSRLRRRCYIPSRLRWQSKHLATATVNRSELEAPTKMIDLSLLIWWMARRCPIFGLATLQLKLWHRWVMPKAPIHPGAARRRRALCRWCHARRGRICRDCGSAICGMGPGSATARGAAAWPSS